MFAVGMPSILDPLPKPLTTSDARRRGEGREMPL